VANFDNLRTVSKRHLVERIGKLSAAKVGEVKRALGYALDWEELIEA
jgi:mRNA-degrading endonuclease toxin of MazEF toxin-antitoxin module